jgi:hypothetical protein
MNFVQNCIQYSSLKFKSIYMAEIIGGNHYEFQRNRSTIDQIFCIRQILQKKLGYNETVHQLFVDFKKT